MYRRGNRVLLGIIAFNMVWAVFMKSYYIWRNKQRDEAWNALSREQKDHYLETTSDEGNKRLDFRFAH